MRLWSWTILVEGAGATRFLELMIQLVISLKIYSILIGSFKALCIMRREGYVW